MRDIFGLRANSEKRAKREGMAALDAPLKSNGFAHIFKTSSQQPIVQQKIGPSFAFEARMGKIKLW